jgi:glycosyltransferase involved in cell wall biosynthesis
MNCPVTVVIPVYNVEGYLSRCLDSVCNQTFSDMEIVCVNDRSPDNCALILSEYAKKDERIKIITHEKNSGLSAARNTGLTAAKGQYIYFIDSDDWIDSDYIEKMYITASNIGLEAVCNVNVYQVKLDGIRKKLLKRSFTEGWVDFTASCIMAWTWLLKKSFLDKFKIIFPEGITQEDSYFFYVVIRSLEKIYAISSSAYYHFENPSSIMGCAQSRIIKGYDAIIVTEMIYDYYKNNNLLDKYSIPFFYLPKYCLNRHIDKDGFFRRLKTFYSRIVKDVDAKAHLYADFELDFLHHIIDHESYEQYSYLDSSVIDALRQRVVNHE